MAQSERRYTYEEYLAFDDSSEGKHEYVNGQIIAMAGGSFRHGELAARVIAVLVNARNTGCRVFSSDVRVRVLATGRATYPDASVVCGQIERDPADKSGRSATNPTLLVEVLSPSTEKDDRGEKWEHYQRIPTLQEYVLVSQDRQRVERFRRGEAGDWHYTALTEGKLELASGGVLDLPTLFADLPDE